jgi:hypothetical protein
MTQPQVNIRILVSLMYNRCLVELVDLNSILREKLSY